MLGNIPPSPTLTPQFSNALCRAGTPYAPRPPDRRPAGRFRPDTAGLYGGGTSIDRAVIALWLGHESVETTQIYLHADLRLKEQAMSRISPMNVKSRRYRPDDKLLAFLEDL